MIMSLFQVAFSLHIGSKVTPMKALSIKSSEEGKGRVWSLSHIDSSCSCLGNKSDLCNWDQWPWLVNTKSADLTRIPICLHQQSSVVRILFYDRISMQDADEDNGDVWMLFYEGEHRTRMIIIIIYNLF